MLIKCPECGEPISDQVETCPKCGMPNPGAELASLQQEGAGRKGKNRVRAIVVALLVILVAVGGTGLYLWRWAAQHDIIRYVVGRVTGTTKITQQHFANVVKGVVQEWNTAAGKTVLWGLPFGRPVEVSLATDRGPAEDYVTKLARLQGPLDKARAAWDAAAAYESFYRMTHPEMFDAAGNWDKTKQAFWTWREFWFKYESTHSTWEALLNEYSEVSRRNQLKDMHISGIQPILASSPEDTSIIVTAYVSDADLRALLFHAFGHALGLKHSSGDDVMAAAGRSTTITKEVVAEAAAGH